jgi:endonuclease/exonuclease/phosphatase family metal-dependent hydrolase
MKICFWNTQRNPALNQYNMAWPGANFQIACEVLGEDTLKVSKRNRRKHMAQLGYRVVTPTNYVYLEEVEIDNFKTLTGYAFWLKGGNSFKKQSKRQVAQVYAVSPARLDENIFIYHCNSSDRAPSLMPWVIAQLVTENNNFILLGDFNCEPDDLMANLSYLYTTCSNDNLRDDLEGVRVIWAGHTHNAKHGATSTLDYIVTKNRAYELRVDSSTQDADHYPIVANNLFINFNGTRTKVRTWWHRSTHWSVTWKLVYDNNGCVAWELVG